jgi:hypothetical protein
MHGIGFPQAETIESAMLLARAALPRPWELPLVVLPALHQKPQAQRTWRTKCHTVKSCVGV